MYVSLILKLCCLAVTYFILNVLTKLFVFPLVPTGKFRDSTLR
jgi:hypothetical protein